MRQTPPLSARDMAREPPLCRQMSGPQSQRTARMHHSRWRALERRSLKRTPAPKEFFMECVRSVVTKPPRPYTEVSFRAQLNKDWSFAEQSLRKPGLLK
jgi:hypothetical protein